MRDYASCGRSFIAFLASRPRATLTLRVVAGVGNLQQQGFARGFGLCGHGLVILG